MSINFLNLINRNYIMAFVFYFFDQLSSLKTKKQGITHILVFYFIYATSQSRSDR